MNYENFESNPNQRTVKVYKEPADDTKKENYYAKINLLALKNAMHTLSPSAFELWLYFSKNQDGHIIYLSKVDFFSWSNIKSNTTYSKAFNELVSCNYLIAIDKEKPEPKRYNFYEVPQETEEDPIEVTIYKF